MTNDKINNCNRVRRACAYEQGSSAGGVTPQCWTSTWHRARPGSSNNVTREYTWGLNMGGGIGGLLNVKQSGQNYSYLYDGKGNVTAVIDSAEATAATYTYDAFGNLMVKTGSLDQPFQFSTKRYDSQTGLVYYGYRFYSPVLGRWINRDPLGEAGGMNLYGFVGGNPVNWVDSDGLIVLNFGASASAILGFGFGHERGFYIDTDPKCGDGWKFGWYKSTTIAGGFDFNFGLNIGVFPSIDDFMGRAVVGSEGYGNLGFSHYHDLGDFTNGGFPDLIGASYNPSVLPLPNLTIGITITEPL